MKAQFKYAFRTGIYARGVAFAVIFVMNLVFIVLGSMGLLPFAAKVTAVALGGVAIAVMIVFNIVSDIAIVSRMFSAPGAYLHALTPAPRKQILLSSILTMMILDIVTMAVVITGEVMLSFNLAGDGISSMVFNFIRAESSILLNVLLPFVLLIAGYLLVVMGIIFCISVNKSVFYQKRAGGLMTAIVAIAVIYIVNISSFLLAPFGAVSRLALFFTITIGTVGTGMYALLNLILAAVLFVLTSKLMERKINI